MAALEDRGQLKGPARNVSQISTYWARELLVSDSIRKIAEGRNVEWKKKWHRAATHDRPY